MANNWYNPGRTRSYNAIFNFIVGNRGGGKTFNTLADCVDRFKKKGEQFIYVRRQRDALKDLTHQRNGALFDDLIKNKERYRAMKLRAEGDILYCGKDIMGWATCVADMPLKKSRPYPNVHTIIFEEFMEPPGYRDYVPGEINTVLDFHKTVDRDQDRVRWFFLGNAEDSNNPYFTYFNLDIPYNKTRQLYGNDNQILVELVQDPEFIEKAKNTRFGQLIQGTKYGDYAIENKFKNMDGTFIAKKTGNCEYKFTLHYYNRDMGIWLNVNDGIYYISDDVDYSYPVKYAATTKDMKPNLMLLKGARQSLVIQRLFQAYNMGMVYYENERIKRWFRDIMKMRMQ